MPSRSSTRFPSRSRPLRKSKAGTTARSSLESVEPDRTVIRWQDHGIPQTREHPVTPFGKIAPFPETPAAWTSISADVLTALAEAAADLHR